MTPYGDSRERSPAFQGARLAFSSPSTSSPARKSPSNTYSGSWGALAAASSVGKGSQRSVVDNNGITSGKSLERWNSPSSEQEHGNNTPSYIAANRAARTSTELLPGPTSSPLLPNHSRPSPLRSYSDLSGNTNTDGPSINSLIGRYEGQDSQVSTSKNVQRLRGKRTPSLNNLGNRSVSHSIHPTATSGPSGSRKSITPPRSSSSPTDSSYTSAADEPSFRPDTLPSLRPHPQPLSRPTETLSRRKSSNITATNNARKVEPTLSNSIIPQLSIDSLANAMVASSLASSRAPSPTCPPLPPPRRRSRPHLFHRTHSTDEQGSRTPSPSKGHMRQTMRAPLDPNENLVVGKPKGKRFIHKHPNKHHEGDRKRWRDQITEMERKRYEGVWAANRGLLTLSYQHNTTSPPTDIDLANSVLNIIVRDIWSRSKLPTDTLEEVWELVDSNGMGMLGKEEFVVGMWLVDQRLKGRKLPGKVSDSVWSSARGLSGVKVRRR
ncbi:MAG: hypothetical protein Q9166_000512 [cf. Caloplaca sp. 2 TL-2023]